MANSPKGDSNGPDLSRRGFLKASALAGTSLVIGLQLGCSSLNTIKLLDNQRLNANAWLQISQDNQIFFILDRVEMGQGTMTGMTTLLAEELEVDALNINVIFAPPNSAYINQAYGLQITGGSSSTNGHWHNLREAGAKARVLLERAAAEQLGLDAQQCYAKAGVVHNRVNGQSLSYGDLVKTAAKLSPPSKVSLKAAKDFTQIGKPSQRLDALAKVQGKADYGIDAQLDNLLYAVILRPPKFDSQVQALDAKAALASKGVVDVFTVPTGVAVVAKSYWLARKAQAQLKVAWQDKGDKTPLANTTEIFDFYRQQAAEDEGKELVDIGNASKAFAQAQADGGQTLSAEYQAPLLAHATLEPQNCTVKASTKAMEIWAPTQSASMAQVAAAKYSRYSLSDITVNTTFLGGGFGRRIVQDYVSEAAAIAEELLSRAEDGNYAQLKHVNINTKQVAVKLLWSREEDTQHDFYRPASLHKMQASFDQQNNLASWQHQLVAPKLFPWFAADAAGAQYPFLPKFTHSTLGYVAKVGEGIVAPTDTSPFEGADELPYTLPNIGLNYTFAEPNIPVGYWRSVGFSHNGFVIESFVDELAHQAGVDPVQYRQQLLHDERARACLNKAVQMANWGQAPAGQYQGVAVYKSFGTWVAQIAQISLEGSNIKVHKVFCAVDCGVAVNPDVITAQMEGGIIFGLTAALWGEISLKDGAVEQSNFHNYRLMRLSEAPEIEVAIIPSDETPTGVGEPGVPPIAAAVANAVFAANGQRLRNLPLKLST